MNEEDTPQNPEAENAPDTEPHELQDRRDFLGSLGKWSGASIMAAVGSAAWLATPGTADAGLWVNRRGGWINRRGGWINGGGGAGWINRYGGGGAGWVNRYGGGGAGWVNGVRGGGGWINRRGGGGWINRR
ncbi:MAG: hypothetical protein AAF591_07375 [Verrucomicrobiota bacterium]